MGQLCENRAELLIRAKAGMTRFVAGQKREDFRGVDAVFWDSVKNWRVEISERDSKPSVLAVRPLSLSGRAEIGKETLSNRSDDAENHFPVMRTNDR